MPIRFFAILSLLIVLAGIAIAQVPLNISRDAGGSFTDELIALLAYLRGGSSPSFVANVMAYGAVGDGTTDDTAAFQAAFNAGGRVWVPGGHTYIITYLLPVSGLSLECENWTAILKFKDNTPAPVAPPFADAMIGKYYTEPGVDNVSVRNCQFNGNKANNTRASAIAMSGVNILVQHNYFHDTAKAAVNLGRPTGASFMRIVDNLCINPALSGNSWGCFAFTGGENLYMLNNTAITTESGIMAYAYDLETNPGWGMKHVLIQGNMTKGGGVNSFSGAIQVSGDPAGGSIEDVLVAHNEVYAGYAGHGIIYRNVLGLIIETNTINNVPGIGIWDIGGTGAGVAEVSIRGNKIKSPGQQGIVYGSASPATISLNQILSAGAVTPGSGNAVQINNMVGGVVTGNQIHASALEGFLLTGVSYATVTGNQVATSGGRALRLLGASTHNVVVSNSFTRNTGKGISEEGTSNLNIFRSNDLTGNTGGTLTTVGAQTESGQNLGVP